MDTVYVHGLTVETVIGIFDWEREIKQKVVLDIEMAVDISPSAATEDIDRTVSYKDVSDRLTQFVQVSEFLLVETMAEEIAALVLSEFPVPFVRIKLGKPDAIANAADVGVIIERGQKPA
ncbi:MAG: dihydroneopterin aldolase [Oceanospirillaceae bacterium]|jgi:dihydroneopterin aldolase|nr:dihydroneopterin aldolase [Oceanospirillaceae bacterium]MBT4441952.1 dihydroneopterin aldolase [Oceanospirillaceae bacterium]MBT6076451.1 dihydroneopterin aldolase [Oceanospirillaceae bacterium]MBT7329603.1 dihydroneopterin aldolase [Oceanospirillaceae bacterium]